MARGPGRQGGRRLGGARGPGSQETTGPGRQGSRKPRCQGARKPGGQGATAPGGQGARKPGSQGGRMPEATGQGARGQRPGARRLGGQGASQLGHQNASKTCTLSQKVGRKHVPLSRKSISNRVGWRVEGVKNAYPLAESASKTRTLRQKVVFEASKTCTLRQQVRQKHVPLCKKSAPVRLRCGIEPPSETPPTGRVKRGFCAFTRVFSCILRHVGSDPQAERGRGEVNLSPTNVLTLRFRVGGFYVSGRLWEAQLLVFYVSGRLREAQLFVLHTLRAVPPTQLSIVRVSF